MKMTNRLATLTVMIFTFLCSGNLFAQRVIEINGTNQMEFSVKKITAKPGEKLTVKLTTVSKLPPAAMSHNFVLLKKGTDVRAFAMASARNKDHDYIDPAKENEIIAHTKLASGGQTVEVTFDAPSEAGDYDYICSFPGHFMKMKGVLTVQ